MSGPDVSHLSPADARAALRSFPRRFGAALAPPDDADGDEPNPAAVAATDAAGRDLAVLGDAVARALVEDRPTVHPAVLDPSARTYPDGIDVSAEAALDLLTVEAEALADRVDHVDADSWARVAVVPGEGEATALDLLREAVRTTAAHLAAAERV